MRATLEALKAVVDEIYAKEPTQWRGATRMILYPPAKEPAIKAFFASKRGRLVPPSYGDFLRASDGLEQGWQRVAFMGTTRPRQKRVAEVVDNMQPDQEERFETFHGELTDTKIKAWEKKRGELFLAHHAVVGASPEGSLVLYDSRTKRKNGDMDICWWPQLKPVQERYPSVGAYFEAVLRDATRYLDKLKKSKPAKKR